MKKEFIIQSEEELREVIGEPNRYVMDKISLKKIDEFSRDFIEQSSLIFVGTSDKNGNQDVSPKGDASGFVKILDESTLLIPERKGNKLAYGFLNILETGKIGLIFIRPGIKESVRINGSAIISKDPELLKLLSVNGQPALLCAIVKVEECFFHCGKAFIRSKIWKKDSWQVGVKSGMAEQLSFVLKQDKKSIQQAIDEDYMKNLY